MQPCSLFQLCLVLFSCSVFAQPRPSERRLGDDLASWPRLKRQAGYFTESGRYRGGLYKHAREEKVDVYQCVEQGTNFCLSWTTEHFSAEEHEHGTCNCTEHEGVPYCEAWTCIQQGIEIDHQCDVDTCMDRYHREFTSCQCGTEAPGARYCQEWSCEKQGSDIPVENEDHICTEPDESGEYCYRWKGDISSKKEIKSSRCACSHRNDRSCDRWTCKERGIIRCSAHSDAWCDFWVAVFVGGSGGLITILIATGASVVANVPQTALLSAIFFGGPWIAGVAIWGGVRAVQYVALVWGIALIPASLVTCFVWPGKNPYAIRNRKGKSSSNTCPPSAPAQSVAMGQPMDPQSPLPTQAGPAGMSSLVAYQSPPRHIGYYYC